MGSFFKDVGDLVKQTAWDQPVGIAKDVVKGDFGGAFDQFTDTFGDNNRQLSKVFNDVDIRCKIGDNPQEAIGAVVGTALGGWMAAPAMGAGAAGTAGATAGSAAAGTAAGAGASALTYVPTASAVLGGSGATTGASALGTLGWSGGTAGTLGSSIGTGAAAFSPAAGSAMAYAPTQSAVLGGSGSGVSGGSASSLDTLMNQLSNMPKRGQQEQQAQPMKLAKTNARGYNPIQGFGSVSQTGRW